MTKRLDIIFETVILSVRNVFELNVCTRLLTSIIWTIPFCIQFSMILYQICNMLSCSYAAIYLLTHGNFSIKFVFCIFFIGQHKWLVFFLRGEQYVNIFLHILYSILCITLITFIFNGANDVYRMLLLLL